MTQATASQPIEAGPAYGRLSVLSWAHFLNDGAANYLPGILPAVLMQMGLSVSLAGVLMGALVVGQGLQPLTGLLADRVGGRSFTVLGLGVGSLAAGAVAFTPDIVTLAFALIVLGTANSFFHPQTLAAVRHSSGERHGMGMAVFMIGGEVGRGVWPLAASLLVTAAGLGSIWILGLPGILTLPFLWRATISLPPRARDAGRVEWHAHMKPLSILVLFSGLRGVLLYAVTAYVPILWNQRGGSLAGGAAFLTTLMIVGLIGNMTGGHLGDRRGRRRVIAIGMVITLLGMIAFMMVDGIWMWVLIAIVGIGLFATFPLTILIAQDIVPENRSFGSGMALGLANAIGALGVMALGPVAGAWGVPAVLWASIVIGALSMPLLWLLPEKHYGP
jgi:FSR family fosmidomycin resistance protein-like MFS transporter